MNFDIKTWSWFKENANVLGRHISANKCKFTGKINMQKEVLDGYIHHITSILREASEYMDKCGLTLPPVLWKYDPKDPTTHPSSAAFKYKDLMTAKQIKAYGRDFMSHKVEEKEAA